MKKLLLVSTLLALAGAGCFSSPPQPTASSTDTVDMGTPAPQDVTIPSGPPAVPRADVDSPEKNLARVLPQPAGKELTAVYVRLEQQGFIAIQSDDQGKPAKVLGQSSLLFAGENTQVPIRVATTKDTTYWATLYLDNGNGKFDPKDPIAKDSRGVIVQFRFRTQPE